MPTTRTRTRRYTQRGVYPGMRRCTRCGCEHLATPDYFYSRSDGTLELCQGAATCNCRNTYFREYAEQKRARAATGANRRFGVEIEFQGDPSEVAAAISDAGFPCEYEGYNHDVKRTWKVVSDSSVSNGAELVSPPLKGGPGRVEVAAVCAALRSAGATVNSTCGLHVHHEVKSLDARQFKQLHAAWYACQSTIELLVSRSRRGGRWCHHIDEREIRYLAERLPDHADQQTIGAVCQNVDRYRGLNINPYPRYGTVEARMHQGTTSGRKIVAWVEFVQAFITAATTEGNAWYPVGEGTQSLPALLASLVACGGLAQETADYLAERARVLGDIGTPGSAGRDSDDYASDTDPDRDDDDDDDDYCDCASCQGRDEY